VRLLEEIAYQGTYNNVERPTFLRRVYAATERDAISGEDDAEREEGPFGVSQRDQRRH
jgi:hypothetical protein